MGSEDDVWRASTAEGRAGAFEVKVILVRGVVFGAEHCPEPLACAFVHDT